VILKTGIKKVKEMIEYINRKKRELVILSFQNLYENEKN